MRKFSLVVFMALCLVASGAMAVETVNAVHRTITVDGNASDWDLTASQPIHMVNPNPIDAAHPLTVDMRCAWDDTYLYFLLQESDNSAQQEAASASAFTTDGPWFYDCISPWIDLKNANNGQYGFNPWFGFSSTGLANMWGARVNNNDTGGFVAAALANGSCATSGTFAAKNRTIEARVMWTDLGAAVNATYLPDGGLAAAITAGMTIGMDPLIVENDYQHQSFLNGIVGTPPSGGDAYSYDIVLTNAAAPPVVHASYTNGGFDAGATLSIDATSNATAPGNVWTDSASIPGWRMVAVAGASGNFSVVAEATAPSAPNVLQMNRLSGPQFQIDRSGTGAAVIPGKTYKHSFWARKITAEAGSLLLHPFAITPDVGPGYDENSFWDYRVTGLTQNVWEKHEAFVNFPAGTTSCAPYIVPESIAPTYQVDSLYLEDATLLDLCPNGRFENADRLIGWNATLNPASTDNLVTSIITDAANVAEGSKALHIVKNPLTGGDTLIRMNTIPWISGHDAYFAFSVKNDPTVGADSNVEVVLQNDAANLLVYRAGGAADGSYKRYEFEIANFDSPSGHLTVDMRFRGPNNEDDTQEALFLDFISLGDLTVGGVPVELSTFEMD